MSFTQALSGLNAASIGLDVTSNNIANAVTPGFQAGTPEFAAIQGAVGSPGGGVAVTGIAQSPAAAPAGESNVNLTGEIVNLLVYQLAFEANAKSVSAEAATASTLTKLP